MDIFWCRHFAICSARRVYCVHVALSLSSCDRILLYFLFLRFRGGLRVNLALHLIFLFDKLLRCGNSVVFCNLVFSHPEICSYLFILT